MQCVHGAVLPTHTRHTHHAPAPQAWSTLTPATTQRCGWRSLTSRRTAASLTWPTWCQAPCPRHTHTVRHGAPPSAAGHTAAGSSLRCRCDLPQSRKACTTSYHCLLGVCVHVCVCVCAAGVGATTLLWRVPVSEDGELSSPQRRFFLHYSRHSDMRLTSEWQRPSSARRRAGAWAAVHCAWEPQARRVRVWALLCLLTAACHVATSRARTRARAPRCWCGERRGDGAAACGWAQPAC
jgi:hypothetical protein